MSSLNIFLPFCLLKIVISLPKDGIQSGKVDNLFQCIHMYALLAKMSGRLVGFGDKILYEIEISLFHNLVISHRVLGRNCEV